MNGWALGSRDITVICVADSRHALSCISAEYYDHPSRRLNLFGCTGSNGKTTLTYILEKIFQVKKKKTGVIGTINYRYGNFQAKASMTTPESLEINRLLFEMAGHGVQDCFMEGSSHALALKRVHGMRFAVGIFTNFSRDHLDFHGTMEEYKNTKKGFFHNNEIKKRVINIDDPVGREIVAESQAETLTIGIDRPADITAEDFSYADPHSQFMLRTPTGNREIQTNLLGMHNVYNLLSGAGAALLSGISLDEIASGMRSIDRVPGRFERVDQGQDFLVVVDYAHTDDALRNVLNAARAITKKNLIVVFGCGGDRDRGKRKEMGRVALELGDFTVITSDNPRSEDPERIIDDILEGVPSSAKPEKDYTVCVDRREAIECAVRLARKDDLVVIAGKGHEDVQKLKTGTIHFDDREVAAEILRNRSNCD